MTDRSIAELEREVEASRTRLELALNDLNREMSIDGVVHSLRRQMPGDLSATADEVIDRAKNNPLPLGLIGAGLAWMLLGDGGPSTRTIKRNARRGAHQIAEGAEHFADEVGHGAHRFADSARHGAEHLAHSARHGAESVAHSARHGAEKLAGGARSGAEWAADSARHGAEKVQHGAHQVASSAGSAMSGGSSSGTPSGVYTTGTSATGGAPSSHAVRHDIYGRPIQSSKEFDDHDGLTDRARQTLSDAGDAMSRRAASARHSAHEFADAAHDQWRDARDQSAEMMYRARDEVVHAYKANPVVLGLGVAALGSLIGVLLPNSRKEDEYLGPYAQEARHQVENAANEAFHKAEQVADEVIDTATEAADEAFTKVEEKADEAIDKAEKKADEAIDKAEATTDDAAKKAEKTIATAGKTDDGKPAAAKLADKSSSSDQKDKNKSKVTS